MMKRVCISMVVLGALSLTACSAVPERSGDIDDVESEEEVRDPVREAEESDDEITAPPAPDGDDRQRSERVGRQPVVGDLPPAAVGVAAEEASAETAGQEPAARHLDRRG